MTADQRQLRQKYTRKIKFGRGNWKAFLCVGGDGFYQEFCAAENCTKAEAEFFRTMLAKAIERLLKLEAQP